MYSTLAIIAIIFGCLFILAAYIYGSLALSVIAIVFVAASFLHFAREHYVEFEDEKVRELHRRLVAVFPDAARLKVSGSNESFTMNKSHIFLCIKDATGNYYDDNSLMYVLLHEYAHVLCPAIISEDEDHDDPKYRAIYANLLAKATEAGIYDPTKPMVQNYCGYK